MLTSEQFRCEIPSPNALKEGVLYCSTNATNSWEITAFVVDAVSAVGTIGAVVVALWLGLRGLKEQRKFEDRSVERDRNSAWYEQMIKLQDAAEEVRMSFPKVTYEQMSQYERELNRYVGFCDEKDPEQKRLSEAIRYNDVLFSEIVRKWNGKEPLEPSTNEERELVKTIEFAKQIHTLVVNCYTMILVPFHQGQFSAGETGRAITKMTAQLFDLIGVETFVRN